VEVVHGEEEEEEEEEEELGKSFFMGRITLLTNIQLIL